MTLISAYISAGTRQGLIDSLTDMRRYLVVDETVLQTLTDSSLSKLTATGNAYYDVFDLFPQFE